MLILDSRPCMLGVYLNTPTQKNGDERVPAKVFGLKAVLLEKDELNGLFDDRHAYDMLYVERKGKPAEPFWRDKLGALPHAVARFVECQVTITFGLKPYSITFADATLKSLKLEPQTGGHTALNMTLVCLKSNIRGDLERLDEHLNGSANVEIEFGEPADDEEEGAEDSKQEGLDLTPQDGETNRRKPSDGATVN